ncbi:kinase-like domain-containing protein [Fennellomyces sp. T-0311]|nr:kinase-like domain-containing protein [Fennellomyces sp. T-0311]
MPPWMAYLARNQPIKQRKQVGDYILLRTIGRGSSGHVKLGKHKVTGEYVAIKMIARRHLHSSVTVARTVERELAILQLIHHPHLISLLQVLQDSTYVYFITEYVGGGELYHVLAGQGRLTETDARTLFIQLATALAWCHAHHICHRDLKPENILLDRTKKILKIADFGMATIQPSECLLKTSCGSPHYASPEIVTGKPYYGPATDVWSCGVILYVLLTGRFPFDDDRVPRLLAKIKAGRHRKLPDYLSSSARDLIRRMLSVDPSKRITMNDILSHPWVTQDNNNIIRRYDSNIPHHLHKPVIGNPDNLHGTIWETLKVLWRGLGHEKIIAALMSEEPNVQKLTFWLLQRRAERLTRGYDDDPLPDNKVNLEPLAHTASELSALCRLPLTLRDKVRRETSDEYDDDDTLLLYHCVSNSTTLSSSDYSSEKNQLILHRSLWSSDRETTDQTGSILNSQSTDSSSITTTGNCYQEFDCNTDREHLKERCGMWTPLTHHEKSLKSTTADAVVSHVIHVHQPHDNQVLQKELLLIKPLQFISDIHGLFNHQASEPSGATNTNNHFTKLQRWLFQSLVWLEEKVSYGWQQQKHAYKIYTIDCAANHEGEAAGKLQQILNQYFEGNLNGRLYPNGQIVWSGSMLANPLSPSVANFLTKQDRQLDFLCHINITKPESLARIQFVLIQGVPLFMQSTVYTLKQHFDSHEAQSQLVIEANGWQRPHNTS